MTSAERARFGVVFVESDVAGIVTGCAAAFCSAVATGARRFRLLQQFVVFFGG